MSSPPAFCASSALDEALAPHVRGASARSATRCARHSRTRRLPAHLPRSDSAPRRSRVCVDLAREAGAQGRGVRECGAAEGRGREGRSRRSRDGRRAEDAAKRWPAAPGRTGQSYSHPAWLVERWVQRFGAGRDRGTARVEQPAPAARGPAGPGLVPELDEQLERRMSARAGAVRRRLSWSAVRPAAGAAGATSGATSSCRTPRRHWSSATADLPRDAPSSMPAPRPVARRWHWTGRATGRRPAT